MTNIVALPLDTIRLDRDLQPRADLDPALVDAYAGLMREGVAFPPVTVYHDGAVYWLADGFHRVHAARLADHDEILADVRRGTRWDAVLFSVGANAARGPSRTVADRRRAVETLLRDDEGRGRGNTWIAERCAVSEGTVRTIRAALEATSVIPRSDTRTGRDGRTINVRNIGKAAAARRADHETPTGGQRTSIPVDGDGIQAYLAHLYGGLMEARPESVPILRRLFFATATRDWATEGPPDHVMDRAGAAMADTHRALERGDYAEALAHLQVWAGLLGVG